MTSGLWLSMHKTNSNDCFWNLHIQAPQRMNPRYPAPFSEWLFLAYCFSLNYEYVVCSFHHVYMFKQLRIQLHILSLMKYLIQYPWSCCKQIHMLSSTSFQFRTTQFPWTPWLPVTLSLLNKDKYFTSVFHICHLHSVHHLIPPDKVYTRRKGPLPVF